MIRYAPIPACDVPAGVRFDIPGRNQGQIVEVAYGGWGRAEHGPGDPYRRTIDRSTGRVTYARRIDGGTP